MHDGGDYSRGVENEVGSGTEGQGRDFGMRWRMRGGEAVASLGIYLIDLVDFVVSDEGEKEGGGGYGKEGEGDTYLDNTSRNTRHKISTIGWPPPLLGWMHTHNSFSAK
ncbi:hypothetical protein BDZ91DRAFT_765201 [Kalaharituber pfeilii]|nr:hypothetical protein BDZ91DRAFT_765201 [Kalaharituber pfeilii]